MEVPRKKDGLHVREIEGQTVILDPGTNQMHTLNATAAFIFEAVDGARGVQEISRDLIERFEVDPGVAEADAARIIEKLTELQLLVDRSPREGAPSA